VASAELQRLWRLAQIDREIADIRSRAANLDAGQRAQAAIDKLSPEYEGAKAKLKGAEQTIADLELKQKGDDQKKKKIQQEMYGGKVVNAREVANLEKEIAMIQRHQDEDSEKLLELYDLLPEASKQFDEVAVKYDALVKQRDEKRKAALGERTLLEAAFKELAARRPEALKGISPSLMARYDNIKQLHNGIGMVEVVKKTGNCGGCGTHLPERTISLLKDDKIGICEDCHRLLYYTEGVV
jgi:predicted  nucleic acid-binding Zn-ribbon protein